MDLQLKQKTAFITGSTQGIGLAIAKQLLLEGANVIIHGRSPEKVKTIVASLKNEVANSNVSGLTADFLNAEEVNALIAQLPSVDILVNNAGIFEVKPFTETNDDDWQRMYTVNVMSGVRLSRALLPLMLKKNWGRIIFISSESGINIPENMIHYGTSKAAMLAISNGLAKLTKNTLVTVNTIVGGPTYSDGVANVVKQIAASQNITAEQMKANLTKNLNPTSLLQRFIEPTEIANMISFLASPLSAATNGSAIRVDGGVLTTTI
ncbi:SDR family NAD(P)-dependent oxidoreductase [Chryseosolibacter indicus]|uniref:SDR family oxidoreductase n=1 Tax=Chryseosolibacter indicus TaxID=2782351 RepID=A0ABS5VRM0_9BACT|nr:SDR family oxidoreductase [Chryseosolibacter indicus]MBT1704094.1 SDR family oxidoreductase [Chryseosolibacter indicus]